MSRPRPDDGWLASWHEAPIRLRKEATLEVPHEVVSGSMAQPWAVLRDARWRALRNRNTGDFDAVAISGTLSAAEAETLAVGNRLVVQIAATTGAGFTVDGVEPDGDRTRLAASEHGTTMTLDLLLQ